MNIIFVYAMKFLVSMIEFNKPWHCWCYWLSQMKYAKTIDTAADL